MQSTESEIWKPVVGYEGSYEVSDAGRVRAIDRVNTRGWRLRGRVMSLHAMADGHVNVGLTLDGIQLKHMVHRLVLEAFIGPCPESLEGCHNDGNPGNNHLSNLRWDTRQANIADQFKHGVHWSLRKTHCVRGHALVGANLMPSALAKGVRGCLACNRGHARSKYRSAPLSELADECYREIVSASRGML